MNYIHLLKPIISYFKVSEDQLQSPEPEGDDGGMAGALMKALQDRQKHIQSSGNAYIISFCILGMFPNCLIEYQQTKYF